MPGVEVGISSFVLGGDGTKLSPTGDIFGHLVFCERSSNRTKVADHVGENIVLSPVGAIYPLSTMFAKPGADGATEALRHQT